MEFHRSSAIQVAFISCLLLLFFSGCSLQKPVVKIESVKLEDIDFEKLTTRFNFSVDNPNRFGLKLAGYNYNFNLDNNSLVSGNQEDKVSIKAKSISTFSFPVTLKYLDILKIVKSLPDKKSFEYKLSGGVKVKTPIGRILIPYQKTGTLPVLRPPSIDLDSIKVKRINLSGANLEAKLKVGNPNDSRFGVDRLSFGLSLGGSDFINGKVEEAGDIKPDETKTFILPIKIDFADFAGALFNTLRDKKADFRLKGTIKFATVFGDINLPYDMKGNVKLDH